MQIVNKTRFALVVDPYRTKYNSIIYFGCFRLYNNEKNARKIQGFDSIPLNRTEEFVYIKKNIIEFHIIFSNQNPKIILLN